MSVVLPRRAKEEMLLSFWGAGDESWASIAVSPTGMFRLPESCEIFLVPRLVRPGYACNPSLQEAEVGGSV